MSRELYKKNIDKDARQELRRKKLLEEQKIKRLECHDEARDLVEIARPRVRDKTKYKRIRFQDLYGQDMPLQLSEWFREQPENLDDWLLVPCPKGERCLVVSKRGHCKMFNKAGLLRKCFRTVLPGGSGNGSGFAVMDGIFCHEIDTFFALDVLWYGKQCFLECEAELRFFWLKSKFEEFEECDVSRSPHKHPWVNLKLLNSYSLNNKEALARALQTFPLWKDNRPELDGFLFYHRQASYTCGPTPLVGWLFPFMIQDVLQLTVSSCYIRPDSYTDPSTYMDDFDKRLAQKRSTQINKQHNPEYKTNFLDKTASPLSQGGYNMECIEADEESVDNGRVSASSDTDCCSLMDIVTEESILELEGVRNT